MDVILTSPANLLAIVFGAGTVLFAVFGTVIARRRQSARSTVDLERDEPQPSRQPRQADPEMVARFIKALKEQD